MKKLLCAFLLAILALSLIACDNAVQPSYRDDTSCAILFENAEKKLTLGEDLEFMEKGELAVMRQALTEIVEKTLEAFTKNDLVLALEVEPL